MNHKLDLEYLFSLQTFLTKSWLFQTDVYYSRIDTIMIIDQLISKRVLSSYLILLHYLKTNKNFQGENGLVSRK